MLAGRRKIWFQWVFWGTCAAYVLFFFIVVAGAVQTPVLPMRYARLTSLFYPTRWGFYTRRTALEKNHQVYKLVGNKPVLMENRPFSAQHVYGLNRSSKIVACETDIMARDTAMLATAIRYTIIKPAGAPLEHYLSVDTVRFNNYTSVNVRYLQGRVLVTEERPLTWREARTKSRRYDTLTVVPLNITAAK